MQLNIDSTYKKGIKLYNVQHISPESLKANFVIRLNEYDRIWKAISKPRMVNVKQHFILQGVTGSGKTTLLNRIALQVESDISISQWLIPVMIREGEYAITSLFSLWKRISEVLLEKHRHNFEAFFEKIDCIEEQDPQQTINSMNAYLSKTNKKIILFIDDLDTLIDNFNPQEESVLSKVLSNDNNIRLIACSTLDHKNTLDCKTFFYQLFNAVPLNVLNKSEATSLLKRLSEFKGGNSRKKLNVLLTNEPEKIESLRRLTDGTPRSIVILFTTLMDSPRGSVFQLLEQHIDQRSPLYKQRMVNFSKQQKPMIDSIALHWDAISAKEIASKTQLPSKQVSAQLSQLERQHLIVKIPTHTKNHLYALKDRFFNIWYLISYGRRHNRGKVNWLARFIETWCSEQERITNNLELLPHLKKGVDPQASQMIAKALACSNFVEPDSKGLLFSKMSESLQRSRNKKRYKAILLSNAKVNNANETTSLFDDFFQATQKMTHESVEKLIAELKLNNDDSKIAIIQLYDENENNVKKAELTLKGTHSEFNHLMLATFYYQQKRYHEALPLLIPYQENNVIVSTLLSEVYYRLDNYLQSEKQAREAIHLGNNDAYLEFAFSLLHLEQYKVAIDAFKQLRNLSINMDTSPIHCIQGIAYKEEEDYELAESSFLKSVHLTPNDKIAYLELADLSMKQAELRETESYFNKLIEIGEFEHWDELIQLHIFKKDMLSVERTIQESLVANYLDAYNTVAWRCFESRFQAKKALYYSNKAISLTPNIETYHTNVAVSLWNNDLDLATNSMHCFLNNFALEIENNESAFTLLFILFLAKKQARLVEQWLREHHLTERLKPLYYALMSLMQDKYPNEILCMGDELQGTVDEILLEVERLARRYK